MSSGESTTPDLDQIRRPQRGPMTPQQLRLKEQIDEETRRSREEMNKALSGPPEERIAWRKKRISQLKAIGEQDPSAAGFCLWGIMALESENQKDEAEVAGRQ